MSPEWITAISAALGSLAVLVAGSFAYMRFVRGRVHHPDLSIVLEPTLARIEGSPVLRLRLVLKNVGTLRLFVDSQQTQRVIIQGADETMWQDGRMYGDLLWTEGTLVEIDIMSEEGKKVSGFHLEPGATSEQSLLVPLGSEDKLAYRVSALVAASTDRLLGWRRLQLWSSHLILLGEEISHG